MRVCRGVGRVVAPGRVRAGVRHRRDRGARGGRHPGGHRRDAPDHGLGDARRRAHPHLAADLRPAGAAREARRRRLGRHRRRAGPRLPRPRQRGRAGLLARPGAARRGRRRGDRHRGRLPPSAACRCSNRSRAASAERVGDGVLVRLEDGREVTGSHVLLAVGSIPQTAGLGLAEAGVALGARRPRPGRPRLTDVRPRHLRGRRLHRGAAPGVRRGDAGPGRHVARPRRRGGAAEPARVSAPTSSPTPRSPRSVPPSATSTRPAPRLAR